MHTDDCSFCELVKNGFPPHLIFENDDFFVMLDRQSVAFGHCMVIPKKHVALIYEMEDGEYTALMNLAKQFAHILQVSLDPKAVSYLVHGAGIRHVHLHLIPLKYGDEVVNHQKYLRVLSPSELKSDAKKLRSILTEIT